MQSHLEEDNQYIIHMLPALPSIWPSGTIKGIKARGGFELDMTWDNGKLIAYSIHSLSGNKVKILIGEKMSNIHLRKGETETVKIKP